MTSTLKVDTIQDIDGNNIINESSDTITIGASGDTVNIVGTLQNNGSGLTSYANSDALTLFNVSGSAPVFACRAFVNFNGTGVVAIRESGNVSSITDNGTGDYTVNFTTAMQDANYCALVTSQGDEGNPQSADSGIFHIGFAAGSIRVSTYFSEQNNIARDLPSVMVATFR